MRKFFSKIHLWLSIPFGVLISVICLTGACLVFEKDITRGLNKHLYYVEYNDGMKKLDKDELIAIVNAKTGDSVVASTIKMQSDPNASCQLNLKNSGKKALCVNPYNGDILGWAKSYTFFRQVKGIHRWLLDSPGSKKGGSIGRYVVGATTIAMSIILISGLIIWIPKTRKALNNRLKVSYTKGKRRLWYDLHVVLGFYATIFLLIMSLTGPTWSFGWYKDFTYQLFGTTEGLKGIIYSLHVGSWGGMWSKILYFIAALIGASLPISGYYLWIKSKRR